MSNRRRIGFSFEIWNIWSFFYDWVKLLRVCCMSRSKKARIYLIFFLTWAESCNKISFNFFYLNLKDLRLLYSVCSVRVEHILIRNLSTHVFRSNESRVTSFPKHAANVQLIQLIVEQRIEERKKKSRNPHKFYSNPTCGKFPLLMHTRRATQMKKIVAN